MSDDQDKKPGDEDYNKDVESQQITNQLRLTSTTTTATTPASLRYRWRCFKLIIQSPQRLILFSSLSLSADYSKVIINYYFSLYLFFMISSTFDLYYMTIYIYIYIHLL